MKRREVLARVQAHLDAAGVVPADEDYIARTIRHACMVRAWYDLAYIKRGTNWREFEDGCYALGTRTKWHNVYPEITEGTIK